MGAWCAFPASLSTHRSSGTQTHTHKSHAATLPLACSGAASSSPPSPPLPPVPHLPPPVVLRWCLCLELLEPYVGDVCTQTQVGDRECGLHPGVARIGKEFLALRKPAVCKLIGPTDRWQQRAVKSSCVANDVCSLLPSRFLFLVCWFSLLSSFIQDSRRIRKSLNFRPESKYDLLHP